MPRWDLRCVGCDKIYPNEFFTNTDARDQYINLVVSDCCELPLIVEPNAANFKLVGKGFHCVDYKGIK